jgi:16S rRNA (uracil1498-N3)-methyltransferase
VSRPRRLFAESLPAEGGALSLPDESLEHVHVLRLGVGIEVTLFDGRGGEARARISRIARSAVDVLAEPRQELPPRAARLSLVVGLPKAGKLELIVRMATELGVHAIHLALTERAVPKGESLKLERLRRVAREASAQSGQAFVPELTPPRTLSACASAAPASAHKLAFWEEARLDLAAATSGMDGARGGEVWAVVGPEGGLSGAEASLLAASGFSLVGLGPHILRVETACVVVSALLLERMAALRCS